MWKLTITLLAASGIAGLTSQAVLAGLFDDSNRLKGQLIVDVGELKRLDCPIGGKYDCLTWPRNLYQFSFGQCMEVMGYYDYSYSSHTALLAVDQAKSVSLFILKSGIGSAEVKHHRIQFYDCPDMF